MRHVLLALALFLPLPAARAQDQAGDPTRDIAELKREISELKKAGTQGSIRIGTVNLVRVFDELEEKVDMNAELRQFEEKRGAQLRELSARVRDLNEKAKLLRPETEEARNNAKLLEDAKREFRSYRDATEDHLYNKLFDFTNGIYKKIRSEVQTYAREAGYNLVLRTRDPEIGNLDESLRPRTRYMELNRRIEARSVIYHKRAFEFTDAIIKRLNDKYIAEKAEQRKHHPHTPPAPSSTTPEK